MIWLILSLIVGLLGMWRFHKAVRRQHHLQLHPEAMTDWERYVRA